MSHCKLHLLPIYRLFDCGARDQPIHDNILHTEISNPESGTEVVEPYSGQLDMHGLRPARHSTHQAPGLIGNTKPDCQLLDSKKGRTQSPA